MPEIKNRFEKQPSKPKTTKSNDGITVVVTLFLLVAILSSYPTKTNKTSTTDSLHTDSIAVVDSTAFNQDTQRIEHGISIFDSTFLLLKQTLENNR